MSVAQVMMDRTAAFYSAPSYHFRGAGGFPVFSGSRRQRGGGILGALAKMVMPVLKNVGKAALGQAVGFAGDVANDVMSGQNFGQSLRRRGKKRLMNTARSGLSAVMQGSTPSGKRRAPPHRKQPPRKRSRQALF